MRIEILFFRRDGVRNLRNLSRIAKALPVTTPNSILSPVSDSEKHSVAAKRARLRNLG